MQVVAIFIWQNCVHVGAAINGDCLPLVRGVVYICYKYIVCGGGEISFLIARIKANKGKLCNNNNAIVERRLLVSLVTKSKV